MMTWLLFIGAFVVRLIGLDQSLWLDEATTARVVAKYNISQIFSTFSPTDFHPPLFYFFMDVWTRLFGYSEVALRMPSVIFSLIAGYILYKRFGRWVAAYFLFNPLIMYYSQEARMYMMAVMFICSSYHFFLTHLVHPDKKSATFLFHLFTLASLLTFYGSVFYLATLMVYLIVKKRYVQFARLLFVPAFAVLFIGSLFTKQLAHSGEQLKYVLNWSSVLGTANAKNLLLFPLKFATGRISWEPKSMFYAVTGLWTLFVFGMVGRFIYSSIRKNKKGIKMALFFFGMPIVLGLIFSLYKPLLQYFRFIYVVPFMCILMAAAAAKNKALRWVFFVGMAGFSLAYLVNPAFHREDWKSLVRSLHPVSTVYMIPSSSDPIQYYSPFITIKDIRSEGPFPDLMYVVPYTTDIYGFDYETHLTKRGYTRIKVINERGVSAELWSNKKSFAQSGNISQALHYNS